MSTEITKKIFLSLGESKNLYSEITPNAVSASKVSWSTTNSSVATVTGSLNKYMNQSIGTVQAIAHGKATIKASVPKYIPGVHLTVAEVTDSCEVVVPRPKVSIEVGHGGTDAGAARYYDGLQILENASVDKLVKEKDITLVVSMELKRQLERHGVETFISRTSDIDDPVKDIPEKGIEGFYNKVVKYKPDIGISVHVNSTEDLITTVKGFEIFQNTNGYNLESYSLCANIETEVKNLELTSRGIKDGEFIMNGLNCPTAYCELGFINNPDNYAQFNTAEKQKNIGTAYAKGILNYLGIAWKP